MGRTSAPRRRVALLSTATRRWSRRGRDVLLGKQDLRNFATAPQGFSVFCLLLISNGMDYHSARVDAVGLDVRVVSGANIPWSRIAF